MATDLTMSPAQLLQLMTWLSPAFPVGAFSYSHGIEYAVECGKVTDRDTLQQWIVHIIKYGSARVDADLFVATYQAVQTRDATALDWALTQGDAFRATREIGIETESQGRAFWLMVRGPWPQADLDWVETKSIQLRRPLVYPVAVAAASASQRIPLLDALTAYLHAIAANLVSAGVRLVPLGQSDGQHTTASLEPVILKAARQALERSPEEVGSAAPMVDWTSARHETQYSRLFRS